jgi:hypothetical protein
MCFTAITTQYLSRIESAEGESPAFDALYGVCSFETSSAQFNPGPARWVGYLRYVDNLQVQVQRTGK